MRRFTEFPTARRVPMSAEASEESGTFNPAGLVHSSSDKPPAPDPETGAGTSLADA